MRLFFDARYIRTDFHDGISRYSAELAEAVFAAAPASGVDVTFLVWDEAQVPLLPAGAETLMIHSPTSPREPFTAFTLNKHKPDVVFSPMQTIGSLGRKYKLILTLHDTIYYRHRTPPGDLPWYVRFGWRLFHLSYVPQRMTLNAADTVATVSETSAEQFAAMRLTKRPVVVIPNAPQRLGSLTKKPVVLGAENLVYMGSFMGYKNVENLVRAMRLMPNRTLHLLSRISPQRKAELTELVSPEGGKVVFHGGVTDAEYAAALADKAILVTTSRDEGYGLPIAEALAMGVPAVVSDLRIFREVAGDGALYVHPDNPAELATAVASLDDKAARDALVASGTKHIARFSWQDSAARLLAAVKAL